MNRLPPTFVPAVTGTISIIINDRYTTLQIREASARALAQEIRHRREALGGG